MKNFSFTVTLSALLFCLSIGGIRPFDVKAGEVKGKAGLVSGHIRGWSSKDHHFLQNSKSYVFDKDSDGFEDKVARLVGRNPFKLATATGKIRVYKGIQKELQNKLGAVTSQRTDSGADVVYLVIPAVPTQKGVKDEIEKNGAKVIRAFSTNAYVVRSSQVTVNQLANNPFVYWEGQIPWDKKIDPVLSNEFDIDGVVHASDYDKSTIVSGKVVIALFDLSDKEKVQSAIEDLGMEIEQFDSMIYTFTCSDVTAQGIRQIAQMQEVCAIEASRLARISLDTSVRRVKHEYIRDNYSFESAVIIGMIDTGLELDHDAFKDQDGYPALNVKAWETLSPAETVDRFKDNPSGHGSHVAGILMSRWKDNNLVGMAPRVGGAAPDSEFQLVRCGSDIGEDPFNLYHKDRAMDYLADDNKALVVNCSWGDEVDENHGTDALSAKSDTIVWENGQIFVFAAGDHGSEHYTIDSPAGAKNVIAVGSVKNDCSLAPATNSSKGPTADDRKKPDIYAPGDPITSVDAGNHNGSIDMSGTSMAAPHVTGFLATLLGHYPTLQRHPAEVKALLMATADHREWLSEHTGVLNSYNAHFNTPDIHARFFGHIDNPNGNNDYWDIEDLPDNISEMYIVLTWIEPAAPIGASDALLNEIDLKVDHDIDGNNDWVSPDWYDNVKFLKIENPPGGSYRIKAVPYTTSAPYKLGYALFYRTNNLQENGQIKFTAIDYIVNESSETATIEVCRSEGGDGAVSVEFTTSAVSATPDEDYNETSGVLSWDDQDYAPKKITVTVIDDSLDEDDETINIILYNPEGGALLGNSVQATLTIVDDDSCSGLAGDFDNDGDVDGGDLAVFLRNFGNIAPSLRGDFDNDGDVDEDDLTVFLQNFGKTIP